MALTLGVVGCFHCYRERFCQKKTFAPEGPLLEMWRMLLGP